MREAFRHARRAAFPRRFIAGRKVLTSHYRYLLAIYVRRAESRRVATRFIFAMARHTSGKAPLGHDGRDRRLLLFSQRSAVSRH